MRMQLLVMVFVAFIGIGSIGWAQEKAFIIDSGEFNYSIGTNSYYYQLANYHMGSTGILPFDVNDTEWDFSSLTSGTYAQVEVLDPTTTPGSASFPGATGCSKTVFAGDTSYMYENVAGDGHYWKGYYAIVLGSPVIADYNPDIKAYHFPMQVGTMWYTYSYYTMDIMGIPINFEESHQSEVVAYGRVKTHAIPYWMECLVIKTFHSTSSSLSNDNYWLYEWVVPNGFSGGNGVVALMSQNNATSDFVFCRYALILSDNTTVTPDLPLMVDTNDLSETGGTVNFFLNAGEANANRFYAILGSASGTSPGTLLPGGHATLPLVWDDFTDFMLTWFNIVPFLDFLGQLGTDGTATAQLLLPPLPPGYLGLEMDYAFCCNNPFDFVSNPVHITIVE
ncbi:MAG: hypothetical protein KJ645_08780 [Planctomycetes bacterium]|nr:hypothetical protein [Planctomycetota bacterium]